MKALVRAEAVLEARRALALDVLRNFWRERIAILWTVDDVLGQCPKLTRAEAAAVPGDVLLHHDAELGHAVGKRCPAVRRASAIDRGGRLRLKSTSAPWPRGSTITVECEACRG